MSSNKYLKPVKRLLRFIPDRSYIRIYYFAKFRRLCALNNPSTYNEKLQWLKLNYRIQADSALVDKHLAKQIVGNTIGNQYIVPTLELYDNADDIDFNDLPDSFVLKCTHDSEGVVVVRDKTDIDADQVRDKLRKALSQNFYHIGREPHYKDLRPRIIAEEFLEDQEHGQLLDYKFYCFNGAVKAMLIASDRHSGNPKFDYFDEDLAPIPLRDPNLRSESLPPKPKRFDEMVSIARLLCQGHPHVRVDLYEVNGQVYFGELTFFPFSGFTPFSSPYWDQTWGDWLALPAPANPV